MKQCAYTRSNFHFLFGKKLHVIYVLKITDTKKQTIFKESFALATRACRANNPSSLKKEAQLDISLCLWGIIILREREARVQRHFRAARKGYQCTET